MYECKTCKPEIKVKVDGQMQPVTGERYFDMLMVKVVDDKAVEWAPTKGGKDSGKSKMTVPSVGKTMTTDIDDKLRETKATYSATTQ